MQIRREEIRTGILVIVSIAILTGVLLAIGAPGVFKPTNTYYIYFDNAAGLNQGAPVMLAGRRIGQVTDLVSPVPLSQRPKKGYEVRVQVEVDKSAQIFNKVNAEMVQTSLLGQPVIDFTGGDEHSGLAANDSYFVGTREKDFTQSIADAVTVIQNTVTPVAVQAEKTMQELGSTADNLRQMTAPGSDVDQAVNEFHKFADNLVQISATGSALQQSLQNIQMLTGANGHLNEALANVDRLTDDLLKNDRINKTLANLQGTTQSLDNMVTGLSPRVDIITDNLEQATNTLKRQPWRLIWPVTKRYPSPTPIPRGRRL
ncbi:MAG TPA: MlaD family protein [Chthoniobacteraceae bacterium]|jgi:phospholipid/cholesterol/gamma-HCH transport system substrate-binding protein|nr:MlaD family protein [Chthoniobacteraceae bacterium]